MNFKTSALHGWWRALRRLYRAPGHTPRFECLCALTVFILGLLVTGCRHEIPANVVIINGNEPESLDPAIVTAVPDMRIAKALFEGLARLNGKTGRPEPGLAERWEISRDGLSYTFY